MIELSNLPRTYRARATRARITYICPCVTFLAIEAPDNGGDTPVGTSRCPKETSAIMSIPTPWPWPWPSCHRDLREAPDRATNELPLPTTRHMLLCCSMFLSRSLRRIIIRSIYICERTVNPRYFVFLSFD